MDVIKAPTDIDGCTIGVVKFIASLESFSTDG
jgi:hypothetical protein